MRSSNCAADCDGLREWFIRFAAILAAGNVFAAVDTARAQSAQAGVSVTTQRFDDWELVCPPAGREAWPAEAQAASCRLQQAQAVNGGKDVVFLFNIVKQRDKLVGIISAPLSVYLPAGLELRIDGGKVNRAVFESCNVTGCHAGFALSGGLLSVLKSGSVLTVTLQDTKATKTPVKVSLKGITAGLTALADAPQAVAPARAK